jgi:glutamate dehydrogenase (NAD(P)+)
VLPAVLCNCGGVAVSYFEWKQNRQAETWPLHRVDEELRTLITAAAKRVRQVSAEYQVNLRLGAYIAALQYISRVYRLRGIFP